MQPVKDTQRAMVRIGYDGRVHKYFRGPKAQERFENEVRVLKYLEQRGCDFVPKVLEADPENLYLVTTNCGARVEHLSEEKMKSIFDELETFGVRHEDAFMRNITYRNTDGRFCVIDFEFATILEEEKAAAGQDSESVQANAESDSESDSNTDADGDATEPEGQGGGR